MLKTAKGFLVTNPHGESEHVTDGKKFLALCAEHNELNLAFDALIRAPIYDAPAVAALEIQFTALRAQIRALRI